MKSSVSLSRELVRDALEADVKANPDAWTSDKPLAGGSWRWYLALRKLSNDIKVFDDNDIANAKKNH